MRNFLSVQDVPDVKALIDKALAFKANPMAQRSLGKNKRIGLLFLNPSMRTRLSTQIAAANLGMEAVVFNVSQEGWALEFEEEVIMNGTSVEHVKDMAPVLGKYFDVLGVRTFPTLKDKEADYNEFYIQQFVKYCGIPVVSLESATLHPLQSLADLITIEEFRISNFGFRSFRQNAGIELNKSQSEIRNKKLEIDKPEIRNRKLKIALIWAPHVKPLPQCVANSFSEWVNGWGEAEFVIAHPEGYELDPKFTKGATITHDQNEALSNADFVYVKNWSAYNDYGKLLSNDADWMLTNAKLARTNQAKVMHCLPVRRNVELSDEILDGPDSLVTQQAGNRVWAAQAVLSEILKK
jgi:N-succinyl-L-ornithine transcarbamylase